MISKTFPLNQGGFVFGAWHTECDHGLIHLLRILGCGKDCANMHPMESDQPASIARRIAKLKRLVRQYYYLRTGDLIERHTELLRVFDVRGSVHGKQHPHRMKRVYITRRSVKHCVESRKAELLINHSQEQALEKICAVFTDIQEIIIDFTKCEVEPPKYIYFKDYSTVGKPSVRVVTELIKERVEIKSIHFTKNKKKEAPETKKATLIKGDFLSSSE